MLGYEFGSASRCVMLKGTDHFLGSTRRKALTESPTSIYDCCGIHTGFGIGEDVWQRDSSG